MKLYFTKGACSLASRIIINELSLNCEYESVDLKTKKTETGEDFLTINPKGSVPVLRLDNDEILTENAVIQQYLAEQHQGQQLLPSQGLMRYRVLEWLNFVATDLHKGLGAFFIHTLPQEIKDQVFRPIVEKKMGFVDQGLENKTYLVGEEFTLPDAYLFVMITWLFGLKFDLNKWSALSAYFDRLKERDAIKQSLEEEHLNLMQA